jgi:hypothetical protein
VSVTPIHVANTRDRHAARKHMITISPKGKVIEQ